jgi:hypothetical protein
MQIAMAVQTYGICCKNTVCFNGKRTVFLVETHCVFSGNALRFLPEY